METATSALTTGASPSALATIDVIIIVGFLVAVTAIGAIMSRMASQGLEDYFLGGNKIPWWVLGISTATSNFDMSGTMIIVAVVFGMGYQGFLVEMRGGVGLSLAFLMVFLGKWLRRSRVMTSAEWMKLRFGTDRQGRSAHLLSAVANVTLSLGMIIYFSKGAGKFLVTFIPLHELGATAGMTAGIGDAFGMPPIEAAELMCTTLMVAIGLFYTLLSGLYGVVFTDVVQMVLLTFTAIYVTIKAFALAPEVNLPDWMFTLNLDSPTGGSGAMLAAKNPEAWAPIFDFFGICVIMWIGRSMIEGMGGVGGYTDQRFFAARSEREASLLTLESIVLSIFRWTMVAGLVVLGYSLLAQGGASAELISNDPEQVLPTVLAQMLPDGIRGIVIAGLIAAAMSTFDSTLNAGASYVVKDIYESYINTSATGEQLMRVSRWATVGLCVGGVGLAAIVPNINQIWDLITMGLGAGLFMPLFLRWYWPRFNGYGFAGGTAAGIIVAPIFNTVLELPLYVSFPTILGTSLLCAVAVTLLTAPTPEPVLVRFCAQIDPWGAWSRYRAKVLESGLISTEEQARRTREKRNDKLALLCAVPFQICVLIASMAFVFHDWSKVGIFGSIAAVTAVGLYVFWFRNLKGEAQCKAEDEHWKDQPLG
ncbi:MAG: sodium:solute symporter family transporter [Bradymonadia bacterium]